MTTKRSASDIYDEFVPFYDSFYADRRAEIEFYSSLLCDTDRSVLELGCGTGVIVAGLAQALLARSTTPVRVVGLDHSGQMLKRARRREPAVLWVVGDMAAPPICGDFDLVFCAFNTLQMLESEAAVLRTLEASRQLLKPQGLLAIDVYNASSSSTQYDSGPCVNRLVKAFTDADGSLLEVREDALDDPNGDWVELDWRVVDPSIAPPRLRVRFVFRLRHYSAATMERLVTAAGLRIVERYGDVWRSRFDERTSRKQVLLCCR